MSSWNVYHLVTGLLIVFATTHTYFGLFAPNDYGPQANAVFAAMKEVQFDFMGSTCTFHGFELGFGLMVTVFIVFSAVLTSIIAWAESVEKDANMAWILDNIKVALFGTYVVMALLSWMYFFAGPGVMSTLIAGLMLWGYMGGPGAMKRKKAGTGSNREAEFRRKAS